MTLPVDYSRKTRSHQVWDKDSTNYFIDNMVSVEDLIDTNNFNVLDPLPSDRMGNKLIRRLDGVYTLYYHVTNVNPLLNGIDYSLIDLESVLLDSLIQNQTLNTLINSSMVSQGLLEVQVHNLTFSTEQDRTLFVSNFADGPTTIPALSTLLGSIDLLPRRSIERLLVN